MTDQEAVDILGQIRNRIDVAIFVMRTSPADSPVRRCLCSLLEDNHTDSQALIDALCIVE